MAKAKTTEKSAIIPVERIAASIFGIRGQRVMFDADLAALNGVETKVFNQAVRRNKERFPEDFMFQLNEVETGGAVTANMPLWLSPSKAWRCCLPSSRARKPSKST